MTTCSYMGLWQVKYLEVNIMFIYSAPESKNSINQFLFILWLDDRMQVIF